VREHGGTVPSLVAAHLLLRDKNVRLWRGSSNRTFRVTAPTVKGWYDPVALDATGNGPDDILWKGAPTRTFASARVN
jgi:hypothetical protein